jgi:DNA-binding NarL/FixJ family response regulator
LIVESVALTRFGLISLTNLHPLCVVCAEAGSAPEARASCAAFQPDLAIINLAVSNGDGFELLKELQNLAPRVCLIALSAKGDEFTVSRAFRAGASAFLTHEDHAGEFLAAIESVIGGEVFASRRVERQWLQGLRHGRRPRVQQSIEKLSDRELAVFERMGRGLGATAIARELGVSVKTIETHQGRMKAKFGLSSCGELQRWATDWMRRHE